MSEWISPLFNTPEQRKIDQRVAKVTTKALEPAVRIGRGLLKREFERQTGQPYTDLAHARLGKGGQEIIVPKMRTLWTPEDQARVDGIQLETRSASQRWIDGYNMLRDLLKEHTDTILLEDHPPEPQSKAHGVNHSDVVGKWAKIMRLGLDDAVGAKLPATMPIDTDEPWLALMTPRALSISDNVRYLLADPHYYRTEYFPRMIQVDGGQAGKGALWAHGQPEQTDDGIREIMERNVQFLTDANAWGYELAAATIIPVGLGYSALKKVREMTSGISDEYVIDGYEAVPELEPAA